MAGRSYSKSPQESANNCRVEPSRRGGYASFGGSRGGFLIDSSGLGGFAAIGSGRGGFAAIGSSRGGFAPIGQCNPPTFGSILQANGIPGYIPGSFDLGDMTTEHKGLLFDEFKKEVFWDGDEEEELQNDFRRAWEIKAREKYPSFMSNLKKCIGKRKSDGILITDWNYLLDKWEDPKVKAHSAIMKANRGRASPHTGGSRSFANTSDLLEEYKRQIETRNQALEENGTPINEKETFLVATGGIKKSQLFRFENTNIASRFIPGRRSWMDFN